jgi:hypothetical protein
VCRCMLWWPAVLHGTANLATMVGHVWVYAVVVLLHHSSCVKARLHGVFVLGVPVKLEES